MGFMEFFREHDRLLRVPEKLDRMDRKLNRIMGYVKIQQEQLDELDRQLDESTAAIEAKLNALDLPEADISPILEDLNNLKSLHTADVPTEPLPDDGAHPDNSLPGDQPQVNPLQ